jgi:hypothetical protein
MTNDNHRRAKLRGQGARHGLQLQVIGQNDLSVPVGGGGGEGDGGANLLFSEGDMTMNEIVSANGGRSSIVLLIAGIGILAAYRLKFATARVRRVYRSRLP